MCKQSLKTGQRLALYSMLFGKTMPSSSMSNHSVWLHIFVDQSRIPRLQNGHHAYCFRRNPYEIVIASGQASCNSCVASMISSSYLHSASHRHISAVNKKTCHSHRVMLDIINDSHRRVSSDAVLWRLSPTGNQPRSPCTCIACTKLAPHTCLIARLSNSVLKSTQCMDMLLSDQIKTPLYDSSYQYNNFAVIAFVHPKSHSCSVVGWHSSTSISHMQKKDCSASAEPFHELELLKALSSVAWTSNVACAP